jgi:sulfoxide reductase heme-binding subunit YedZ
MKLRPPWLRQAVLLEVHRMSGVLAGGFLAGHLAGVLVDPSFTFGFTDLALGLTAPYRPLALTLGAAAMWMMVAVLASTAFAAEIPQALWRRLHFLAFPAYLAALLHGLTAGTDTGQPFAMLVYAATAGLVAALTVARLPRQGRRAPAQAGLNERPGRRRPGAPRWQ